MPNIEAHFYLSDIPQQVLLCFVSFPSNVSMEYSAGPPWVNRYQCTWGVRLSNWNGGGRYLSLVTYCFSNIDETFPSAPTFYGRPITMLGLVSSFLSFFLCCRRLTVLQSVGCLVLTFWHCGVLPLVRSSPKQFCCRAPQVAVCDKFLLFFVLLQESLKWQHRLYLNFICLWTDLWFYNLSFSIATLLFLPAHHQGRKYFVFCFIASEAEQSETILVLPNLSGA